MGILDKITDAVGDNPEQVNSAIDKAGDVVDEKTGGQFEGQVDQAQEFLKDQVAKAGDGT
ncbi:antitoxin [Propionicicella superfundia]|uniref:antitoxin n=1 Tax=Propionicicella superfundia TaxID=348582 RepID=UPI000418E1FE|nr:antitoxin [Propionicicella superfundia]